MQNLLILAFLIAAGAIATLAMQLAQANDQLSRIDATLERIADAIDEQLWDYPDDAPDMAAMLAAWRAPHSEPLTTEKLDKVLGRDGSYEAIERELLGQLDRHADPLGR